MLPSISHRWYREQSIVWLVSILMLMIPGCELFDDPVEIPAYITIEEIDLVNNPDLSEGSLSNYIVDAWVYVDDQLIGAFELPATFPVLHRGDKEVAVYAGVFLNGVRATRVYYPFYAPSVHQVRLTPDSITTITPVVKYDSRIKMPLHESFELGGVLFEDGPHSLAELTKTDLSGEVFEGNYSGKVELNKTDSMFHVISVQSYILPSAGGNVFLELDYKTEAPVMVGLYANKPGQVARLDVAGVLPNDEWNKVYINLTPIVFRNNDALDFRIYFTSYLPEDQKEAAVLFDNIKLIHF